MGKNNYLRIAAIIVTWLVAVFHYLIMVMEMFFWDHPVGREVFSMSAEQSSSSAVLAFNQGVYNAFLATGLVWGLLRKNIEFIVFFLLCVIVAGVVGAATAKFSILFSQAMPAFIALILWLLSRQSARHSEGQL